MVLPVVKQSFRYCKMVDAEPIYKLAYERPSRYLHGREIGTTKDAASINNFGVPVSKSRKAALLSTESHCADWLFSLDKVIIKSYEIFDIFSERMMNCPIISALFVNCGLPFILQRVKGLCSWT